MAVKRDELYSKETSLVNMGFIISIVTILASGPESDRVLVSEFFCLHMI